MPVYADTTALAAFLGTAAPSNATLLLRKASALVRTATLTAVYDVDTNGLPTDTTIAAAMSNATCCQVETWIALGIDPAAGAGDSGGVIAAKNFGPAQIQYAVYASTAEERARAAKHLCAEAHVFLREAGLYNHGAEVIG